MGTTGAQRVHAIFKVKAEGRTRLVVFDTQDLTLGRSPENDLAIDDAEVSRRHCVFKRSPSGCRVEDVGTANGTGVNGESVDHAQLSHGDVVRIGDVEITYAETTRSPATLGPSVEYASQLKSFAAPAAAGGDGEATLLGLMDTVTPGDEAFEVQPAGDFDTDLHAMETPGGAARDLDTELETLETDPVEDFQFDTDGSEVGEPDPDESPPAAAEARPLQAAPEPSEPPASDDVWVLDDDELPEAPTAAPTVAPTPTGASTAAPTGAGPGRLTLSLEIEGLEGELRRVVEALAGKELELPPLRVRIKGSDL